jgi:hypothetical protein
VRLRFSCEVDHHVVASSMPRWRLVFVRPQFRLADSASTEAKVTRNDVLLLMTGSGSKASGPDRAGERRSRRNRRREATMKTRTADAERRRGIHLLVFGGCLLVAMLGIWWLVENTNREGEHDAQLLPFFALIPLLLGAYSLIRSRIHHA